MNRRAVVLTLIASLLLSEAPVDAPRHTGTHLTWRLSIGSFLGSVWAAPSFRANVERLQVEQLSGPLGQTSVFDSQYLIYAAPVLGPWLTASRAGEQAHDDMWMLVTSGLLQGVGITTLAYRALTNRSAPGPAVAAPGEPRDDRTQLVLDISPYVAGRLGLSIMLTGW